MKRKEVIFICGILLGLFAGYFWPRNHYEIRGERLCAVSWDGSAGCVQYQADWLPEYPR